jgi:hypothetical protein
LIRVLTKKFKVERPSNDEQLSSSISKMPSASRVVLFLFAALGALLRLPLLNTPLTSDEGGFAYIVRSWSRGGALYDTIWVDRPQALLLMYRGTFASLGDTARSVRILAMFVAACTTVVIGLIAFRLTRSSFAALVSSLLYALLSAMPQIEGHTANGELLSALPSSLSLLCLIAAIDSSLITAVDSSRKTAGVSWLARLPKRSILFFATGAFVGTAMLVKQSAFDALIVVSVAMLVCARKSMAGRSVSVPEIFVCAGGFFSVVGLAAIHGATLGWSRWYFAIIGYRLHVENLGSGTLNDRWLRLYRSMQIADRHLIPLGGLVIVGVLTCRFRSHRRLLPLLWLAAAGSAFALGGLFHAHYYIGLCGPISLVGGLGIERFRNNLGGSTTAVGARRTLIASALSVVVPVVLFVPSLQYSRTVWQARTKSLRSVRSSYDTRLPRNAALAKWLKANTKPGEPFYALYADAALYFDADRPCPYPYLWERGVERIPGALPKLIALLQGPNAPRYVVQISQPMAIVGGAKVGSVLSARYHKVTTVEGIAILKRNDQT